MVMSTVVMSTVMMPAPIMASVTPPSPPSPPMPVSPQRTSRDQSDHGKDEARCFDHADSCLRFYRADHAGGLYDFGVISRKKF